MKEVVKVLVVDDDEDDFILMKDYLSDVKNVIYDLEWVYNYKEAIKTISRNCHDIYVFDYNLGEFNGLELLKEMNELNIKAPVILLTGNNNINIDIEAMKTGAYEYLVKKEVTPSTLERSMRYALERKRMEDDLYQEKEKALVTLESIGDCVLSTDINGSITSFNYVAEKLTGLLKKEVLGKNIFDILVLIDGNNIDGYKNFMDKVLCQEETVYLPQDASIKNFEGKEYYVEGVVSPIKNRLQKVIGSVVVLRDVTNHRELTKKLHYQARHDVLTGLPNRFKFEEDMIEVVNQPRTALEEHALLYLDLDQFKIINDTCGHFAGDQFLKQIALLMKNNTRETDIIARLGGDEFGILLKNISPTNTCKLAEKICNAIQGYRFVWNNKLFTTGVSIGIVTVNQNYKTFETLLSEADRACYVSKEKGGNTYQLYVDEDEALSERHGEMQWMSTISEALEDNRFVLHYQKIKSLHKENSYSYEALIRMVDKEGNLIYPGAFLSAAQRYNMMPAIDRWVFKNFLIAMEKNSEEIKLKDIEKFNINISGASLNNESIVDFIISELEKYDISPEKICFEITETIALSNFNIANDFINKLRRLGCKFALDDFGSGLTSFEYLKYLPIDYLKIDGSFIKNINNNPIDYAMVDSINQIAHLLNIETVAEFVENEKIVECLNKIGIDYAQGYHIGKPMVLSEVLK
ncbi:PAS domain S-box-containing protein/diguanylate cyclase (GGDEF)-like protein [Natranaerovirga pectinivora]|uniref:Stage 0 sporulation protein A homolog n=1 Tax=Natranaerovirga pectinivora TaxID=682400 RepID=A0A4R3MK17_9FIRM|nr:EAL domain-containing protein [Natranaerovirga pectinivora]TCT13847.1 PAS domain S-box-containing protein/diguanylate cyclase (GGDEF)-like protein [Natranaerovirga pectinivora]